MPKKKPWAPIKEDKYLTSHLSSLDHKLMPSHNQWITGIQLCKATIWRLETKEMKQIKA